MPYIRRQCGYPLTAAAVVRRIYTDLAVIDVTADGLVVREMVDDIDFPALQAKTEAPLRAATAGRPRSSPAARACRLSSLIPHLLVAALRHNFGDRAVGRAVFDRDFAGL